MCEQQRRRSACASAQADQRLCCSLSSFFFSTKKRLTNLNGEQNDTGNLLVFHRICHFRAIQPFDYLYESSAHVLQKCWDLIYKQAWDHIYNSSFELMCSLRSENLTH